MTLEASTSRVQYATNGTTGPFSVPFYFLADAHLQVVYTPSSGVSQTLTLTTDYSVSGALNPAGGSVTTVASYASGGTITIVRSVPLTQLTDYEDGDRFPAESHETALDKLTMIDQQQQEALNRALVLPVAASGVSVQLPLPVADQVLGWNAAGNAIRNRPLNALSTVDSADASFLHPKTGAATKNVYLNLIQRVPVVNFGVAPDQTAALNTTGLQSLFTNNTRFEAIFGDGDYQFNNLVTVPNGVNAYLTGAGSGATTLFQTDLTKGLLKFDMNYARGAGVRGMSIFGFVPFLDEGSTGIGLHIVNSNTAFVVDDVVIERFNKGVRIDGSYYVSLRNFIIRCFTNYGLYLSPYTVAGTDSIGSQLSNGIISNLGFTGSAAASVGILCEQGSGEYWKTIDVQKCNVGIQFKPPSGSWVRYLFLDTVLADDNITSGFEFDGSAAQVVSSELVNCWASFNGGAGLVTKGSGLDDLMWVGGKLRENGLEGWDHQGGSNVTLMGTRVSRNSRASTNVSPGIRIRAGVDNWRLIGVKSGNFSTGVVTTEQAEGLLIESGASTGASWIGCDFSLPGTGKVPVSNGNTSGDYIAIGNLPLGNAGVNVNRGGSLTGASGGTVAAGATVYLGSAGASATENDTLMVIGRGFGVVAQLLVQCESEPGAGQSYTYTLMRNNVATSMAVTISDTGVFQAFTNANGFTIAVGDYLSLRLVTSAGATVGRHRFVIDISA